MENNNQLIREDKAYEIIKIDKEKTKLKQKKIEKLIILQSRI